MTPGDLDQDLPCLTPWGRIARRHGGPAGAVWALRRDRARAKLAGATPLPVVPPKPPAGVPGAKPRGEAPRLPRR